MTFQTREPFKPSTTLFFRILGRLSLPLFILALIFTAIELANQMNALNEVYRVESQFALDSIHNNLSEAMKNPENAADLPAFNQRIAKSLIFPRLVRLQVFNLANRAALNRSPDWTDADYTNAEQSLDQKQQGRDYLIVLEKESKHLLVYLPLEGPADAGTPSFIAKAVFSLASMKDALEASRFRLGMIFFFIFLAGIFIGQGLANSIVKPIKNLNEATREIMKGKLGSHVRIRTGDEIEALAVAFNQMSDSLEAMKKQAEDANPLTGLPGNQRIFSELRKRIYERQKFVLFHIDLDRFKVFNDHFGLARGDEAIKLTAELLKKTKDGIGAADDFIGHQGGDDFIMITRPNHAQEIAEYFCRHFNSDVVPALYSKKDLEQGYTLQIDRRRLAETGQEVMIKFPLLAISVAGVSSAKRDFADYFDCMSAAVEVKKEVKNVVESSYAIRE